MLAVGVGRGYGGRKIMKSFTQPIQETSTDPDNPAQTFPMTLRDFIDSLEFFDNKDRIVEVFIDSPVENAICVKFPPIEEHDQSTDLCAWKSIRSQE